MTMAKADSGKHAEARCTIDIEFCFRYVVPSAKSAGLVTLRASRLNAAEAD
jgi:hypothetical protein